MKCKYCKAEIIKIKLLSGKIADCNLKPVAIVEDSAGDVFVVTGLGEIKRGRLAINGAPDAITGFLNHYDNCPYFRQKRGEIGD